MDSVQKVLITILIGLLLIIVIYYVQNFEGSGSKKQTFLIVGCNNSGKTTLFNKLTNKPCSSTISSMEANYGTVNLPFSTESIGKPFQLIDYPGYLKYENLFKQVFEDINLTGVVFMIDSDMMNFNKQLNLVALKMFKLLTVTERVPNGVDYLLAVNKSDLFNSLPVPKIRQLLEAEMNKVIESELKNNEDDLSFWNDFVPFSFEKMSGNMEFKPGSVTKDNFENWRNWMDERVVNP